MSIHSPSGSPGFWSWSARGRSACDLEPKTGDPPRPAKDGFEWVWYPEGYWAERSSERQQKSNEPIHGQERAKHAPANSQGKIFKWGARPRSSIAELPEHSAERPGFRRSATGISPLSDAQHPLWQLPKNLPQSPYLSESEQVAALQQSVDSKSLLAGPRIRDTWTIMDVGASVPVAAVASPGTKATTAPSSGRLSWMPFHKYNVSSIKACFVGIILGGADNEQLSEPPTVLSEEESEEAAAVDTAPSYFTQKPGCRPLVHTPSRTSATGGASNGRSGSGLVPFSALNDCPSPAPAKVAAPVSVSGRRSLRKWIMTKMPLIRKGSLFSSTVSLVSSSREKWMKDSTPSSPASVSSVGQFNRPGTITLYLSSIVSELETDRAQSTCRARPSRILQV